jgi:hypothetical protein
MYLHISVLASLSLSLSLSLSPSFPLCAFLLLGIIKQLFAPASVLSEFVCASHHMS